jgi:hypothetical protein
MDVPALDIVCKCKGCTPLDSLGFVVDNSRVNSVALSDRCSGLRSSGFINGGKVSRFAKSLCGK